MIRINLAPQKRGRTAAGAAMAARGASGQATAAAGLLAMVVGWVALGGVGWYLVSVEEAEAQGLREQAAAVTKQVADIRAEIDEAGLQARADEVQRQQDAIAQLAAKKRTPAFVMYELASILTDPRKGGGVTIDQEKYNRNKASDPQSEINERWDPSGLWLTSVVEEGGRLAIEGVARDAADLAEFTRRLRASVWFGDITHPNYERVNPTRAQDEQRNLTWKLDVQVQRWD